jgi:hypothetical protein
MALQNSCLLSSTAFLLWPDLLLFLRGRSLPLPRPPPSYVSSIVPYNLPLHTIGVLVSSDLYFAVLFNASIFSHRSLRMLKEADLTIQRTNIPTSQGGWCTSDGQAQAEGWPPF